MTTPRIACHIAAKQNRLTCSKKFFLKFAEMTEIGSAMIITPPTQNIEAKAWPKADFGETSPYPTVVMVTSAK